MIIQVNTSNSVSSNGLHNEQIDTMVRNAVQYVANQVTRVEVHLSDENSDAKSGANDKRCRLEARLAGHQPILVTHHAPTFEQSVSGAAGKLKRALDSLTGRLSTH